MRRLDVFYNALRVGTLAEDNDLWRFDYDAKWQRSPKAFDLSPALPRAQGVIRDGGSDRPVQWYFDNLLPEEALRQVVAKEANLPSEDAFSLLAYYGAESAGALELLEPETINTLPTGKQRLSYDALSRRIRSLPQASLQKESPKRMSLAGAQHKMLIILEGDTVYEPEAGTPSTHILKPDHPDQTGYPGSVINEYFTMRLAGALGLDVPAVQWRYVPEPVYIVERFDRAYDGEGQVQRRHAIDTCQLLNRARTYKYSGANLDSMNQAISLCRSRITARMAVFRWLAFNILTGNSDNHLKNLSYLVSREGIQIAPAYDLLSTAVYDTRALADERERWPHCELALHISSEHRTFGQVTRDDLIQAGVAIGLARQTAERELDRQRRMILTTADQLIDDIHEEHRRLCDRSPDPTASRRHWGTQDKVLRSIRHIILSEMQDRFSR